jgi:hypothetical protein
MAPSRLQSDVLSRRWSLGGVDRRPVFVVADFLTGPLRGSGTRGSRSFRES